MSDTDRFLENMEREKKYYWPINDDGSRRKNAPVTLIDRATSFTMGVDKKKHQEMTSQEAKEFEETHSNTEQLLDLALAYYNEKLLWSDIANRFLNAELPVFARYLFDEGLIIEKSAGTYQISTKGLLFEGFEVIKNKKLLENQEKRDFQRLLNVSNESTIQAGNTQRKTLWITAVAVIVSSILVAIQVYLMRENNSILKQQVEMQDKKQLLPPVRLIHDTVYVTKDFKGLQDSVKQKK